MRTLVLLAAVIAVLLATLVWLVANPHVGSVGSTPSLSSASDLGPPRLVDGLREPMAIPARPAAPSDPPVAQSRGETLRAAVRAVVGDVGLLQQFQDLEHDPEEAIFPFERLRDTLESLGAGAAELRTAFETADPGDPSRPGLLIGMGWDPRLDAGQRSWLGELAGDVSRMPPGSTDGSKASSRAAATYALRFAGSDPHLVAIFERNLPFVEREPDRNDGGVARRIARIALEGLQDPAGPELAARLQEAARLRMVAELPQAAWRALTRVGGDPGWRACVAAVREKDGPGIAGLGGIRDPNAFAELRALVEEPWPEERRTYQTYVAPGAAEGILSIGTPEALAYVEERLSIGDPMRGGSWRESMIEGVRRSRHPAVLGDLIALAHRGTGDDEVSAALGTAVERARRRMRLERLTESEKEALRASLRRCLETVPPGSPAYEQAASLLEIHGDDRDRSELESR